jgi:hypothetical protein
LYQHHQYWRPSKQLGDFLILVDRIVDKINNSIGQDPDATHIIGVLDIYGFESFKINRFVVSSTVWSYCKYEFGLFFSFILVLST